jgi:two-component system sensor histidine kinase/response regulator
VTTHSFGAVSDVPLALVAGRIWRRVLFLVCVSTIVTIAIVWLAYGSVDLIGPAIAFFSALFGSAFTLGRVARYQILLERGADHLASTNEELTRVNCALEAQNDDLTMFARTVAHDLKGPLSGVVGWTDYAILQVDEATSPDVWEALANIRVSSLDAIHVVDGILALAMAHGDLLDPVSVDPRLTLERAVERVRQLAPNGPAIIELFDDAPSVLAHPVALEAVWSNLLSNAVKYGGDPPMITVTADATPSTVRFGVTDNGPGVVEGSEPFGEFHVEQGSRWSHGLGLPITLHFVERFGGRIGHNPVPKGGTTFWFELPMAPAA